MNEQRQCPICERHCDLDSPGCPRGEAYARTGVMPEQSGHGYRGNRHEHGGFDQEGHGRGSHEHGRHGPHDHGGHEQGHRRRGKRDGAAHQNILESDRYIAMNADDKCFSMLQELSHICRFRFQSKGSQGRILQILLSDGPMTQRDLTRCLDIQPGSVSEVLGKLQKNGLIERTEDDHDRRTVMVSLTEKGREKAEDGPDKQADGQHDMFAILSPEEKTSLLSTLEKLYSDWRERDAT